MDKSITKKYIHIGVAVLLWVLLRFVLLEPSELTGLTAKGVSILACFIPVCYLWITVDILWPSVFAVFILSADGVASNTYVINNVFGHYYVALTVTMALAVDSMRQTGFLNRVGRFILSRHAIHGKPWLFFSFFSFASILLSGFVNYINASIIMLALAREISDSMELDRKHSFHMAMLQVIMATTIIGQIAWPFGKAVPGVAFNQLVNLGIDVSWMAFIELGCILAVLGGLIIVPLAVRFFLKPDVTAYDRYDDAAVRRHLKENPMDKREIASAFLCLAVIISLALPSLTANARIKNIGMTGLIIGVTVIAGLIRIDGAPVIDWNTGIRKAPWRSAIFMGGCFLFVGLIGNDEYGITAFLTYLLEPIANAVSPVTLVIIGLIIAKITTDFLSNTVVCIAVLTAFLPMLAGAGLSDSWLITFAVLVSCMASAGIITPAGSSSTAYITSPDSDITVAEAFKFNLVITVLYSVLCVVVLLPIGIIIC